MGWRQLQVRLHLRDNKREEIPPDHSPPQDFASSTAERCCNHFKYCRTHPPLFNSHTYLSPAVKPLFLFFNRHTPAATTPAATTPVPHTPPRTWEGGWLPTPTPALAVPLHSTFLAAALHLPTGSRPDSQEARRREQEEAAQHMSSHREHVRAARSRVNKDQLAELGAQFASRMATALTGGPSGVVDVAVGGPPVRNCVYVSVCMYLCLRICVCMYVCF